MTVAMAWRRQDKLRNRLVTMIKMTYGSGDTTVTVDTGLSKLDSFDVSPTSVATKYVTDADVSGGIITLTVTNPLAPCYLTVTAFGL